MSQQAAQRLLSFLSDLSATVTDALNEPYMILSDDVRLELKGLWEDVNESRDELDRHLQSVAQEANKELDRTLANAGLDGTQLDVKLAGFQRALKAFNAEKEASSRSRRRFDRLRASTFRPVSRWLRLLAARRGRRLRAGFRSLLRWGDVILGTLVSVIPGGEAYKEAKEAVEAAVEDADDPDLS